MAADTHSLGPGAVVSTSARFPIPLPLRSVRGQIVAILAGFLLLVSASAAATFAVLHAQSHDAALINLAGRQRMLTQRMAWLASTNGQSAELAGSVERFTEVHRALLEGGVVADAGGQLVVVDPPADPQTAALLQQMDDAWSRLQPLLEGLAATSPGEAGRAETETALRVASDQLLAQLEAAVQAFEAQASSRVRRLRVIQAAFLGAALALLAWGFVVTRRRIIVPLAQLGAYAERIGARGLHQPLPESGADEFGALGRSIEAMRKEIAQAHYTLEGRVAQRVHEFSTAFAFSQQIVAQLELGDLLNAIVERTRELLHASAVRVCLLSEDGRALELVAGHPRAAPPIGRQSVSSPLVRRVVGAGETVALNEACDACAFLVRDHLPGTCLAAPLRVGDEALGAICAVREGGSAPDADTRALTLLANAAAIAIANARLVERERRQAEELAALAEREWLAADLHDNLAQTLSYVRLQADRLREHLATPAARAELGRTAAAVDTAYRHTRALLVGLQSGNNPDANDVNGADPRGREAARRLAACVDEFRASTGVPVELTIADRRALALAPVARTQALHIVREALTNAQRHAQPGRICVRVDCADGAARLVVEDDGCGFEPADDPGAEHMGLNIMRLRAERSGGRLHVVSHRDSGTQVTALFPLQGVKPGGVR